MLSQSLFSFLSLLCTLSHAAPAAFPVAKRSTASRGLLYAPGPALSAFHGKVSWSVNWATAPSAGSTDLGEYVAQLWGTDANHAGNFKNDAGNYQDATLIGYNEPDNQGQAWILPSQAIAGWDAIDQYRTSKNARIGTPSVSNSAIPPQTASGITNPQGIEWIREFLSLANGKYKFDILAFHWYGGDGNDLASDQAMLQAQADAMISLAAEYGITDVWITEMQRLNGASECQFVHWFETVFLPAHPKITHYAYNENAGSLTSGSGLSAVGQAYVGEGYC